MEKLSSLLRRPLGLAVAFGLIYGLVLRLAFSAPPLAGVMSLAFIFFVPAGLGALTIWLDSRKQGGREFSFSRAVLSPWVPTLACVAATFVTGWEGTICIIMATPVLLLMASLGGLTMAVCTRHRSGLQSHVLLTAFLLAPLAIAPVESQVPFAVSTRTVATQIEIQASAESVWKQIIRVPAIKPDEHRPSWFHRLGFPKPIEATLSHEGVGGVRHASFEGQLVFTETVYEWQEPKRLSFAIRVDPKSIPPTTLDEHVTIGGPFFDVLTGTYEIESRGPDRVVLHLSSDHRLSTHFNFYSGLWSDLVMRDIQSYILEVIKRRAES